LQLNQNIRNVTYLSVPEFYHAKNIYYE
jgi:hypothetical protein